MDSTVVAHPLLVWGLATFHAAFFVLVAVYLFYLSGQLGDALSGLNTFIGFGIFFLLWLTTWWTAQSLVRSLAGRRSSGIRDMAAVLGYGAGWGAANGALFLLGLLPVGLIVIIADFVGAGKPEQLASIIIVGPVFTIFATAVAAVVGLVVGLLFGVIDAVALLAARGLAPVVPAEPDARVEHESLPHS